jgi:hypothetical protein
MHIKFFAFLLGLTVCGGAGFAQNLRITDPPDGAILNRHDGTAVSNGLQIVVKGDAGGARAVRVNGAAAKVSGGVFEARVTLTKPETRITAKAGPAQSSVLVLWDRESYPRYRFSVDDNIWFLRDIARNQDRYQSLFDNPYLAFWREMHRKYGTQVQLNIFYETDGFNLTQMPDKYKAEWRSNRDWLRLTFHARAEFPDKPYIHAPAEQIRGDYRLVTREIERFAGREVLNDTTTVHWGEATREGARALRQEGIHAMPGYFLYSDGKPMVSYYLDAPQVRYLMGRNYWKDTQEDIIFVRHTIIINTVALDQIVPFLEQAIADPHQSELLELMIHEQYFYPDYFHYEPDYRQRVERAIEFVTRKGYKPTLCYFPGKETFSIQCGMKEKSK